MKPFTFTLVLVALLISAQAVFAEDGVKSLLDEGKKLFAEKKWPKAMEKFTLARQRGISGKDAEELALYMGGLYVQMNNRTNAVENFNKYLRMNPASAAPDSFTEQMKSVFEEAKAAFPIPSDIQIASESFKPYEESLKISFKLAGSRATLDCTSVFIRFMDSAGKSTFYEKEVRIVPSTERNSAEWQGIDKSGAFLPPAKYQLVVRAVRQTDGWSCMTRTSVAVGGNTATPEFKSLLDRSVRTKMLSGKLPVTEAEGKKHVRVKKEPMISTSKGQWNTLYYICIGSIRDGLDFPIKYLCSTPYLGHALTVVLPVAGAYSVGKSAYNLDRADYYDPLAGYDEDAWQSDSRAADANAATMSILAPVWALAYGGVMSVMAWAGTDDGIEKGFNSYIESNTFNRGYDWKYFFPNYRSLNFSDMRVDEEELGKLQRKILDMNNEADLAMRKTNEKIRNFNAANIQPRVAEMEKSVTAELHDFAVITIEKTK
jgi:hypothetical protein